MIGVPGFDSRRGLGIFLFTTASIAALGPTQPPIRWVPEALSQGVKRPGRKADHSPLSSAEVIEWVDLYLQSPNTSSWRDTQFNTLERYWFTIPVGKFQNSTINQTNIVFPCLIQITVYSYTLINNTVSKHTTLSNKTSQDQLITLYGLDDRGSTPGSGW